jgi:hypothetical protein
MQRTPNPTDEELMVQLAGGKLDAAALLFQRYKVNLFNFFLRQGIAREASEDLVQNLCRWKASPATSKYAATMAHCAPKPSADLWI